MPRPATTSDRSRQAPQRNARGLEGGVLVVLREDAQADEGREQDGERRDLEHDRHQEVPVEAEERRRRRDGAGRPRRACRRSPRRPTRSTAEAKHEGQRREKARQDVAVDERRSGARGTAPRAAEPRAEAARRGGGRGRVAAAGRARGAARERARRASSRMAADAEERASSTFGQPHRERRGHAAFLRPGLAAREEQVVDQQDQRARARSCRRARRGAGGGRAERRRRRRRRRRRGSRTSCGSRPRPAAGPDRRRAGVWAARQSSGRVWERRPRWMRTRVPGGSEPSPARSSRWESLRLTCGSASGPRGRPRGPWTRTRSSQSRSPSSARPPRRATIDAVRAARRRRRACRKTPSKDRPSAATRSKKNVMPGRGSRKVRGVTTLTIGGGGDPGHGRLQRLVGGREDDVVEDEDRGEATAAAAEERPVERRRDRRRRRPGPSAPSRRRAGRARSGPRGETPSEASGPRSTGRDRRTSSPTSRNGALRRTAKSASSRIVRIRRMNV